MVGNATVLVRTQSQPVTTYLAPIAASTSTSRYLAALDRLLTLRNENGYRFQASLRAYRSALAYLEAATTIMLDFPDPEFTPDGEGGIDIEWLKESRSLTLSCRGSDNQRDFIYWEENGEYDGKDVSLTLLINRLNWLNHA